MKKTLRTALVVLLLTSASACTAETSTAPASKPAAPAPPATAPVSFETTDMTLKGKPFKMEVAQSDAQTQRGLMYRDSMPADHGMLFVMSKPDLWAFWMDNTRIPLDIIFVDAAGKVLEIHNRVPLDKASLGPASPAQYIIELNLGVSQKIGLRKGDSVEIPKKYVKS